MNKCQNAIGVIKACGLNIKGSAELLEDVKQIENTIIEALEKQIPKKVELYKHCGEYKWENYPCPYCGEMLGLEVNKRYVKFCPNCGQALDWSDTNDR